MLDIKAVLEQITGVDAFEDTKGENETTLPYVVFLEESSNRGADNKNLLKERSITVELYTSKREKSIEKSIEDYFNDKGIEIRKGESTWIDKDYYMMTPFYFDLLERI